MKDVKVMIAVPNLGHIHVELVKVLLRWHMTAGTSSELYFMAPRGIIPHDAARNFCVNAFLQTPATHLFFLDSDVIPPPEALEQLLAADKDVVAGLYATQKSKGGVLVKEMAVFNRIAYVEDGETKYHLEEARGEGIQEIDRAGTGCLMIKRAVLEAIPHPIFQFGYTETGIMSVGEDINFCRKTQEAGFKIWAHFGVVCKHNKSIFI